MNEKTKTMLGYIGIGLAAALISGAAVWAIMNGQAADEMARAETAEKQVQELEAEVEGLASSLDSLQAAAAAAASSDAIANTDAEPEDPEPSSTEDGRHFCYIREVVNETGTTMITVDYADMLTGDEAAAAAAAAGQESPPPNDFFITNVNPLLREFPVRSGIDVTLRTSADGTDPEGYTVPLGQWQDFFVGMSPGMEIVQQVPYWIEIEDDVVVLIEEQYIP